MTVFTTPSIPDPVAVDLYSVPAHDRLPTGHRDPVAAIFYAFEASLRPMKASVVIEIGKGLLVFVLGLVFVLNAVLSLGVWLARPAGEAGLVAIGWVVAALMAFVVSGVSFTAARQQEAQDVAATTPA